MANPAGRRCAECLRPVDHAGVGSFCLRCQRIRDRRHGDRLAELDACTHCGDTRGPLIWWAPPESKILRTLEELGLVRVSLFCDACVTCAGCGQYVAPGSGMPPSVHLPALHRACLKSPAGQAAVSELRRMLGGGGTN